jgi:hypothetical protein
VHGILGGDWIRRHVVDVDYAAAILRIHRAEDFRPPADATTVPIALVGGIPFVEMQVSLPNGKTVEGSFLVDSAGGLMAVHVFGEVAERRGLLEGLHTRRESGVGIGGVTGRVVARGEAVTLGGHRLSRPVVAFTDDAAGLRANPEAVGLVGVEVLRRFRVILDYAGGRMLLQPNDRLAEPFVWDAAGLRLRAEPPDFAPPVVSGVLAGSPAEEAGIVPGDVLLRVGGRDTSDLERVREALRQSGRSLSVELVRGGESLRVTLETRELLP